MSAIPNDSRDRQAYYAELAPLHLAPLWEVLGKLVTPTPTSACQAAIWRYEQIRPSIMQAGEIISAKEAVRRVLVLQNPGLAGASQITTCLYAGLQLILPGEVAPAHRHSQSALRFVIEGEGAYTAVNGEKTIMNEGDFVITPSWTWHDHGNDSDEPMVWLDGLDVPLVQMLDASFAEEAAQDMQTLSRPVGDSLARYGSGLLPVDQPASSASSPVFNYPYARTREALEQMRKADHWDPCHGLKLRFVNPLNGDFAMPTIATFMQLIPKQLDTLPYRSSDATVFSVVEGSGYSEVGELRLTWKKRDTFVIPSWMRHRHVAEQDAVLFSFSDRATQTKLGLWREQRADG